MKTVNRFIERWGELTNSDQRELDNPSRIEFVGMMKKVLISLISLEESNSDCSTSEVVQSAIMSTFDHENYEWWPPLAPTQRDSIMADLIAEFERVPPIARLDLAVFIAFAGALFHLDPTNEGWDHLISTIQSRRALLPKEEADPLQTINCDRCGRSIFAHEIHVSEDDLCTICPECYDKEK